MSEQPRVDAYTFEMEAERREAPRTGGRVVARHRAWAEALEQAAVLLHRLEVPSALADAALAAPSSQDALAGALGEKALPLRRELRALLVQHASDLILNAGWYQEKVRKMERRLRVFQVLALSCVLLIVALFGRLAMVAPPPDTVDASTTWIAQISLFGTLFFGVLKALAAGTNIKKQLTAFWEAGADLKEALFTFEHAWKGRISTPAELYAPDFATALYEELRNARTVVRRERAAFFDAYASPEEILAVPGAFVSEASASAAGLAATRAATANERLAREAATAKDIADARRRLIDAKAKLGAREKALEEAKAAGLDTTLYQGQIIDARAELEEASRSLRMKLKVARLNPD